jgi:hypothetical protein
VVSTLDQAEQHWGNNTGEDVPTAANFKGDFKPASATDLALLPLVGDSSAALVAPEADLRAAIEKTYWIEDPTKNHLESLDCVACHVASQARWWSERARQIDTSSSPAIYRSDHWNLTTTTQVKGRTNALRGFGYYDDQVAITQRTVNDSAAEADYINQLFLPFPSRFPWIALPLSLALSSPPSSWRAPAPTPKAPRRSPAPPRAPPAPAPQAPGAPGAPGGSPRPGTP